MTESCFDTSGHCLIFPGPETPHVLLPNLEVICISGERPGLEAACEAHRISLLRQDS
jgi:hypothetical protein